MKMCAWTSVLSKWNVPLLKQCHVPSLRKCDIERLIWDSEKVLQNVAYSYISAVIKHIFLKGWNRSQISTSLLYPSVINFLYQFFRTRVICIIFDFYECLFEIQSYVKGLAQPTPRKQFNIGVDQHCKPHHPNIEIKFSRTEWCNERVDNYNLNINMGALCNVKIVRFSWKKIKKTIHNLKDCHNCKHFE